MKLKISLIIVMAILTLTLVGCKSVSYGEIFNSSEELSEFMTSKDIDLKYISSESIFHQGKDSKVDKHYIASYDNDSQSFIGYKTYYFAKDYKIAVYGFNSQEKASILSDMPTRVVSVGTVNSKDHKIEIFEGENVGEGIFLIGKLIIDEKQYEIRVVGNKEIVIKKDNEYYNVAIEKIKEIFDLF